MKPEVEQWDTEDVLAFVHDVRPWRDLSAEEKAEWCRRVKYVRENVVTTDGERWTSAGLASLFGLAEAGLEKRFRTSGRVSEPAARREPNGRTARAAATMRNSTQAAEVLRDPEARRAVAQAIAADPSLGSEVAKARQDVADDVSSRREPGTKRAENAAAWSQLASRFARFRQEVQRDLDGIDPGLLGDTTRATIEEEARLTIAACEMVTAALRSGDWDLALTALVGGSE